MSILHQNIQHFASRSLALEIILDEIKPDILVLSEHKLNENEIIHAKVKDYLVVSAYCRNLHSGGGVMIMSRNNAKVRKIEFPVIKNLVMDKEFECCTVECKLQKQSFILVGVYRTPGSVFENAFLDKLNTALDNIREKFVNIVVAGDINIDVLTRSKACEKLCKVLKQHNMRFLVNFPTRVTIDSESAIDNFLTNFSNDKLTVTGIITELSDHDAQLLEFLNVSKENCKKTPLTHMCRKFSKSNIDFFKKQLEGESWKDLYLASVDTKYDVFYNIFMYYFNLSFPKVKSRINDKKDSWVTPKLRKDKEDIICLSQTIRLTKDRALKQILKAQQKNFKSNIVAAKKDFIENKIKSSSNVCKSTWKVINSEIKNNPVNIREIKIKKDGVTFSDPYAVSEIFNDYFVDAVDKFIVPHVFDQTLGKTLLIDNIGAGTKFYIKPVDEIELDQIITSFSNKFSSGFDEVPMPVIKGAKQFLIKPLMHVINSSFISGIFPEKLKISKIKTMFKKGNESHPTSYRPLSILSAFSKIFERVMYIRLINFLESNNLFDEEQHGFRAGKSVVTAGVDLVETIINAIDKGNNVVGIFMDLSKAFDSVSHSKLVSILHSMGIQGLSLKWFESYLNKRKQFVETVHITQNKFLEQVKSSLKTVKYGVPQGSILGPVLFLCYLKNLPSVLENENSKFCLYADDSNLIVTGKHQSDIESTTRNNFLRIREFFNDRNLLLNLEKTNCMSFCTRQNRNKSKPNINTSDYSIEHKESVKFLGLYMDKNLSWNCHINHLEKKISSGLFVLKSMSKYCSIEVLKVIYFAHIHSHIAFGIALYGATSDKNLQTILILQKKAVRIIFKLNYTDSVKDYFSKLGILTVYGLFVLETVMLFKISEHSIPKLGSNHSYLTRNRHLPAVQSHSLKLYRNKPSFAGVNFYNRIPKTLHSIQKLSAFKIQLKGYLINKALYSFEEL